MSFFLLYCSAVSYMLLTIITGQSEQMVYFNGFDNSAEWIIVSGPPSTAENNIIWEPADGPGCFSFGDPWTPCLHLLGDDTEPGIVSKIISMTGYHTIRLVIDVRKAGLEGSEYCYVEYRSAGTVWTKEILEQGGGDVVTVLNKEIIIPNTNDYNNQSSFEIRIGISADRGGDQCFYDNLEIFAIQYPTASPTISPTTLTPTTDTPTTNTPITISPTTNAPTTTFPTTQYPTTSIPSTSIPTTSVPTSGPTTSVPTTSIPTTSIPTTSVPITSDPTTYIPTTYSPVTKYPTTITPTTMGTTTFNMTMVDQTSDFISSASTKTSDFILTIADQTSDFIPNTSSTAMILKTTSVDGHKFSNNSTNIMYILLAIITGVILIIFCIAIVFIIKHMRNSNSVKESHNLKTSVVQSKPLQNTINQETVVIRVTSVSGEKYSSKVTLEQEISSSLSNINIVNNTATTTDNVHDQFDNPLIEMNQMNSKNNNNNNNTDYGYRNNDITDIDLSDDEFEVIGNDRTAI